MAPPVAAVRHPHLLLRRGGILPASSRSTALPFASRGPASARVRLPPPRFSLSPVPKSLSSHVPVRSLFAGIVEEVGRVRHLGPPLMPSGGGGGGEAAAGLDLEVETKNLVVGTQLGDSVDVDGTCLTVASIDVGISCIPGSSSNTGPRCSSRPTRRNMNISGSEWM
jgi:riboflavin synthase